MPHHSPSVQQHPHAATCTLAKPSSPSCTVQLLYYLHHECSTAQHPCKHVHTQATCVVSAASRRAHCPHVCTVPCAANSDPHALAAACTYQPQRSTGCALLLWTKQCCRSTPAACCRHPPDARTASSICIYNCMCSKVRPRTLLLRHTISNPSAVQTVLCCCEQYSVAARPQHNTELAG